MTEQTVRATTLAQLKEGPVKVYPDRTCSTCSQQLSKYNPNKHCSICYATGKASIK